MQLVGVVNSFQLIFSGVKMNFFFHSDIYLFEKLLVRRLVCGVGAFCWFNYFSFTMAACRFCYCVLCSGTSTWDPGEERWAVKHPLRFAALTYHKYLRRPSNAPAGRGLKCSEALLLLNISNSIAARPVGSDQNRNTDILYWQTCAAAAERPIKAEWIPIKLHHARCARTGKSNFGWGTEAIFKSKKHQQPVREKLIWFTSILPVQNKIPWVPQGTEREWVFSRAKILKCKTNMSCAFSRSQRVLYIFWVRQD